MYTYRYTYVNIHMIHTHMDWHMPPHVLASDVSGVACCS